MFPVLLKTNEPGRLHWGEKGKESFLHCSTFDIQGLFHKESHNGYSHFSVQIYRAILAIMSRGKMCTRVMLLLKSRGFQVVIINLSLANNISNVREREGNIFSF